MPPRKRTTPAKPTPAEAAANEVAGDADIDLEFRGRKFTVKAETRASFRLAMAWASGNDAQVIFEMISPEDQSRFMSCARPGEGFVDVATEFFTAFADASGEGNS